MNMMIPAGRLERKRKAVLKSRSTRDRHGYFHSIAVMRYVLRKVFRLVEAQAKRFGIDPLAHQGLLQIYGSKGASLSVKEIAERLDISPAFASSLVKLLVERGYVTARRDKADQRIVRVAITKDGKALLYRIDEHVQIHVDYFTRQLSQEQREAVVSVLMHYVGASLDAAAAVGGQAPHIRLRSPRP